MVLIPHPLPPPSFSINIMEMWLCTSSSNLIKLCISLRHLLNRWWVIKQSTLVQCCTVWLICVEYICLNITSKALKTMCINIILGVYIVQSKIHSQTLRLLSSWSSPVFMKYHRSCFPYYVINKTLQGL